MEEQTQKTTGRETVWNKDFSILFLVNIIAFLGFQLLNPNITKFAANLGMASSILGLLGGAYAFAALLARPVSGCLTDRKNKKMLFNLSLLGLVVCFLGYPIVRNSFWLIVVRFVHGAFFGLNTTVSMTMAANALPHAKLSSGLGFFGISGVASMAIAPSIGIWIVQTWGYSTLFLAGAASTMISLLLALGISDAVTEVPEHARTLSIHDLFAVEALMPMIIGVFASSASGLCSNFMVLFADERGIPNIGIFFTVEALALLLVRPVIGRIADQVPPAYIGIPCCLCMVAAMVMLGRAEHLVQVLIAGVLFGVGYSILPLLQSMSIQLVGKQRRGVASSTYYIGIDLGNTGGPMIGGLIAASIGYANTFLWFSIPAVVAGILLFVTRRAQPEKELG